MKNFSLTLTSKRQFDAEVNKLLSQNPSKPLIVNITQKKKKRSLPANAVYYAWLPAIADCLALLDVEARRYIKLNFGLHILADGESEQGAILIDKLSKLGFFDLPYADRLEMMDIFPVTSLMVTSQHKRMRDNIQRFFDQQGLHLEYGGEDG